MQILNAVEQTPKTRSAQVVQLRRLRPKTQEKILKIISFDRKVKLQEIADILKISKGTGLKVVHENLSIKKLYSKWVPRWLTLEQKQQRIHDSERCLKLFTRNKKDIFRRYITMNETWIHHFTPESKRASAEWRGEGESRPKRQKTQQSTGKYRGHDLCILGHARNCAHRISSEGPDDQQRLHYLIGSLVSCATARTTDNTTDWNLRLSLLMTFLTANRSLKRHFSPILDRSFFCSLTEKRLQDD